ncbi:MAG: ABC transporter permease [Methylobacteriaceae bacterium]|nr:ABC transporter permease [Methylobacteriaceae bacterium]
MNSTSDVTDPPGGPASFERVLPKEDTTVAVFESHDKTLLTRLQHFLHGHPTAVPFVVLILGILVFGALALLAQSGVSFVAPSSRNFFLPSNLSVVLQQVTITAIVGMAQTLVILTAGIDLSVGAMLVLSHVVMGRFAVIYGWPIELAFPLGLLLGTVCGLINGSLVTYLKLPPFIVTLGTLSIFGALNIYFSKSETIREVDIQDAAPFLEFMGTAIRFGTARLIYGSILMLAMAVCFWYVLNRTAFGRHIHATGDDPDAARLAGINTDRVLLAVYTIAGFICAVGGWVMIGRIGAVSPTAGGTANLDSITAVVIGGTSLFGGRGSILGTLIGALIVGVFRNGLALAGLSDLWQDFTVGVLIILAVSIDQWIRRVSA